MFPFQKIFTLLIRTFSRPMLGYFKNKQKLKENSIFGRFFVGLGRKSFAFEHWMNYRMLKTLTPKKHTLYKQQVLLEKGVQTFYEILFYMIVLGLPFWELYKGSMSALEKEKTLQKRIQELDHKLEHINKRIDKLQQVIVKRSVAKNLHKRESSTKTLKNNTGQQATAEVSLRSESTTPQAPNQEIDLQQIIEHAVEVVADEFEDSLDELTFSEDSSADLPSQTEVSVALDVNSNEFDAGDSESIDQLQTDSSALESGSIGLQEINLDIGESVGDIGVETEVEVGE